MLKADYYTEPSELDKVVFEKLVPTNHYLRQVKAVIDFEQLRELVKDCYSASMGRGAEDNVWLTCPAIVAVKLRKIFIRLTISLLDNAPRPSVTVR